MPFYMVHNDITAMKVDAIVNAANESLLGGAGVDGAIHRAAGPGLLAECRTLGGCRTGRAKLTKGYRLPAKFVIHTVGPVWRGGGCGERELLASAYRSSLELALAHGCQTVAFPLISSGAYGYPWGQALKVAEDTIADFLLVHEMTVWLVIFEQTARVIAPKLYADIAACIGGGCTAPVRAEAPSEGPDENFFQMLLHKIHEQGMTEAQFCQKANIDRRLFSKIRTEMDCRLSKPIATAFAVALELPLEEAREMREKAGFAFSRFSEFDVIVEYFIARRNYNIFEINKALFAFEQSLLGA